MSRGIQSLKDVDLQWLHQNGFPCKCTAGCLSTQNQREQVYAADVKQPDKGSRVEEEIKRKLYLLHAGTDTGASDI